MRPEVPRDLLYRATQWGSLHRWERFELGKALRRLGLTYGEIRQIIPVPKGTLSCWCRDIVLSETQVAAIKARMPGRKGVPADTQRKRRLEIQRIRHHAELFAAGRLHDPFFVAGTVLYWAEGSKTRSELSLSNADPRLLRTFIAWVRRYHGDDREFVLKINLHADNDEPGARRYWARETGLGDVPFHKTFIKPDGTGHRKNHLAFGVCSVRVRRCADAWNRTKAWINVVAVAWSLPETGR